MVRSTSGPCGCIRHCHKILGKIVEIPHLTSHPLDFAARQGVRSGGPPIIFIPESFSLRFLQPLKLMRRQIKWVRMKNARIQHVIVGPPKVKNTAAAIATICAN